jgi:hypothetical protein
MYSRRHSVEEKHNKRKTVGFILLTIGFILFTFFYGIPLFVKVSSFFYDLQESSEPVVGNDTTPPPPPSFSSLPEYTNEDNLTIKGRTEAGVTVVIYFNNKKTEVLANSDGKFEESFGLNKGENDLYAYSIDSSGNEGKESQTYVIVQDDEEPELEIISPSSGSEFYGSLNKQINIEGQTEAGARVQVNDRLVIVASDGKFSSPFSLSEGENAFKIKVTDRAGNETEKEIKVSYYD